MPKESDFTPMETVGGANLAEPPVTEAPEIHRHLEVEGVEPTYRVCFEVPEELVIRIAVLSFGEQRMHSDPPDRDEVAAAVASFFLSGQKATLEAAVERSSAGVQRQQTHSGR